MEEEAELLDVLVRHGRSPEDAAYLLQKLRPWRAMLDVGRILGRRLTRAERQRAWVRFEAGESVEGIAAGLQSPVP